MCVVATHPGPGFGLFESDHAIVVGGRVERPREIVESHQVVSRSLQRFATKLKNELEHLTLVESFTHRREQADKAIR